MPQRVEPQTRHNRVAQPHFVNAIRCTAAKLADGGRALGSPSARSPPATAALAVAQVPMGVAIVMAQSLRGAGATRDALTTAMVGALAVRITATWGFVYGLGLGFVGVWMGSGADWVVRMVLSSWRWRRGRWAKVRV